jgi:hypothetical protein
MSCEYCRMHTGATVTCAHPKCHTSFHPLCARKVGCFSVCKHSTGRGRQVCKTWCVHHSSAAAQREKETTAVARPADNGEKRVAAGKKACLQADEDIALLKAELKARLEAQTFLSAVRFDLESARMLASQVCSRSLAFHAKQWEVIHYCDVVANLRALACSV